MKYLIAVAIAILICSCGRTVNPTMASANVSYATQTPTPVSTPIASIPAYVVVDYTITSPDQGFEFYWHAYNSPAGVTIVSGPATISGSITVMGGYGVGIDLNLYENLSATHSLINASLVASTCYWGPVTNTGMPWSGSEAWNITGVMQTGGPVSAW